MTRVDWFEIWADVSAGGISVLVLRQLSDGSIEVLDPSLGGTVIQTFHSYDEGVYWLSEDEYEFADGRLESGALAVRPPAQEELEPHSE